MAANPDQWTGFFKEFMEDYEREMGKPPVLNPQLRFKRCAYDSRGQHVALTITKGLPPDSDRRSTIRGSATIGGIQVMVL